MSTFKHPNGVVQVEFPKDFDLEKYVQKVMTGGDEIRRLAVEAAWGHSRKPSCSEPEFQALCDEKFRKSRNRDEAVLRRNFEIAPDPAMRLMANCRHWAEPDDERPLGKHNVAGLHRIGKMLEKAAINKYGNRAWQDENAGWNDFVIAGEPGTYKAFFELWLMAETYSSHNRYVEPGDPGYEDLLAKNDNPYIKRGDMIPDLHDLPNCMHPWGKQWGDVMIKAKLPDGTEQSYNCPELD